MSYQNLLVFLGQVLAESCVGARRVRAFATFLGYHHLPCYYVRLAPDPLPNRTVHRRFADVRVVSISRTILRIQNVVELVHFRQPNHDFGGENSLLHVPTLPRN